MIVTRVCGTTSPGARDPLYTTCVPPDTYQSLYYHRSTSSSAGKSHWALISNDECHSFCIATDEGWTDNSGDRWYVTSSGAEVGSRQERVATYPAPSNSTDPWHGFPVSTRYGTVMSRRVPKEILDLWTEQNATKRELLAKLWKRAA